MNNKTLTAVILILSCVTLSSLSAADEVNVSGKDENYIFDANVNGNDASGIC